MARTEKTSAGIQYVIPGAERRTAPGSVFCQEPWGQLLIPGVDPVSDTDRLKLRAKTPLRPRRPQQPLPSAGLFGG
jgi:hypothetical protein